ncbi:MAG: hypothetical protein F6J86_13045 [Symploca sp. SIO1B1]|nr:hypothetical protein [Symploca sp. SIO1B1]
MKRNKLPIIAIIPLALGLGTQAAPAQAFFFEDFETDSILDWFSAENGDEKELLVTDPDPLQSDTVASWTQFQSLMAAPESYTKVDLDPNYNNFIFEFDFFAKPGNAAPVDNYLNDQYKDLEFQLESFATEEWQRISLGFTTSRNYVDVHNLFEKFVNVKFNSALESAGEMFFDNLEITPSAPPPPPPPPALPATGGQIFSSGGEVVVQVLPNTAAFTSKLCLFQPYYNCFTTNKDVGSVYNLGSFAPDVELVFGIEVQNTGNTFRMGPRERNADGLVHAQVDFLSKNTARVGFEDLWKCGYCNYNDNNFLFLGGISNNANPTINSITGNLFNIPTHKPFNFSGVATDPGVYDTLTYEWDFNGDGIYSDFTGQKGLWSFTESGIYNISLRVSDGRGGFAFGSFQVEAVPESSSSWLGLLIVGVAGILLPRSRR